MREVCLRDALMSQSRLAYLRRPFVQGGEPSEPTAPLTELKTTHHTFFQGILPPVSPAEILGDHLFLRLEHTNTALENQMLLVRGPIHCLQFNPGHTIAELTTQRAAGYRLKLLEISNEDKMRAILLFLQRRIQPRPLNVIVLVCLVTEDSLILVEGGRAFAFGRSKQRTTTIQSVSIG